MRFVLSQIILLCLIFKLSVGQNKWLVRESPLLNSDLKAGEDVEIAVYPNIWFVSHNDTLHSDYIWFPIGWKSLTSDSPESPLHLGPSETLYFGELQSRDEGRSWDTIPGISGYHRAFMEDKLGNLFYGTSYDAIGKKDKDSSSFKQVHFGDNFGWIKKFYLTNAGDYYAVPYFASRVVYSSDSGETWDYMSLNLNSGERLLYIDPFGTFYSTSDSGGLRLSSDNGKSWLDGGLHNIKINSIYIDSSFNFSKLGDGPIYAGTDEGLYSANGFDLLWKQHSNSLNVGSVLITDSIIHVAGSRDKGIIVLTKERVLRSFDPINDVGEKFKSESPFNLIQSSNGIEIQFENPNIIFSEVTLLSPMGRRIKIQKRPFSSSFLIKTDKLNPGIYILRVGKRKPIKLVL